MNLALKIIIIIAIIAINFFIIKQTYKKINTICETTNLVEGECDCHEQPKVNILVKLTLIVSFLSLFFIASYF